MRRVVGLVLAGLGTCLIVFAVLMPTWVSSRVLKFPLNEYQTATLTAGNVSYFSPARLAELTNVNMEATYTLKGNAAAGSSSTAVWNEFTYVYDQTNKLPFQTMTRTFAFNRRTAQLADCCGASVDGNSSIRQTGYVGYVLPIGTQKQTYDIFDTNLNKPMPFTYAGTGTVNGIQTYKFTENVAPTQMGSQNLPGSLVNMPQASVTLPQYYENHVTYWIDPDTGALLNVTENEKLTLQDSSGHQALLLLDGNFAATQASVNSVVAQDKSERNKLSLVTATLPLVTGIAGVVLLVLGIVLARRPRQDVEAASEPVASEPVASEPVAPEPVASESAAFESADSDSDSAPGLAAADQSAAEASIVPGLEEPPHEATVESPVVNAESTPAAEAAPTGEAVQAEEAAPAGEVAQAAEAANGSQPASGEANGSEPATTSRRGRRGAHRR